MYNRTDRISDFEKNKTYIFSRPPAPRIFRLDLHRERSKLLDQANDLRESLNPKTGHAVFHVQHKTGHAISQAQHKTGHAC